MPSCTRQSAGLRSFRIFRAPCRSRPSPRSVPGASGGAHACDGAHHAGTRNTSHCTSPGMSGKHTQNILEMSGKHTKNIRDV